MSAREEPVGLPPSMPAEAASVVVAVAATGRDARRAWWAAAEQWLERTGERLNPILVKETRQALKSRQFVITFSLLLICGWVWSILGMVMIGPAIYFGSRGPEMFMGYYVVLAFPMTIIVPFGAFRSLAAEQEDRTYELLSISTLTPRQIVSGKLGSAVLQMLIYLSAISPCLAFTYLLRGIDLPTIAVILVYTCQFSLGLSLVNLLAATLTSERHWQVVLSVFLIGGLFLSMYGACAGAALMLFESPELSFDQPEFWIVNAAIQTAYWSYFMLLYYAAAARMTFASDNRSTRMRAVMIVQHALWAGWMGWAWIGPAEGDWEVLLVFLGFAALHWYVMGALMTGESPDLSPRVKRALPQSFLGRVFLTWLNPGPGTGYLLAVCGMLAALALAGIGVFCHETLGFWTRRWTGGQTETVLAFGLLELSYLAAYAGLGLIVLRLLRKFYPVGILLTALVHFLLLLVGWGLPWVIHMSVPELRRSDDYNLVHVTDPFWSPIHVADRWRGAPAEGPVLLVVVPAAAACVFLLNLKPLAREVRQLRVARPRRVEEEDAALAAVRAPPQPVQISPWDVLPPSPPGAQE